MGTHLWQSSYQKSTANCLVPYSGHFCLLVFKAVLLYFVGSVNFQSPRCCVQACCTDLEATVDLRALFTPRLGLKRVCVGVVSGIGSPALKAGLEIN